MVEKIEMPKKSVILAELSALGITANPGKKQQDLFEILQKARATPGVGGPLPSPIPAVRDLGATPAKPMSDTDRIMNAIGGVAKTVENLATRVNRLENGGKDDFKLDAKSEDVMAASAGKEGLDPKIVKIVEDTLGIDFGIEVKGNTDRPGFELSILVPRRLSHVPNQFRPVRDEVTGQYKLDENKRVVEEEYWPGDKRSMQLGAAGSYEMIQDRCNRIRAFIMSWYQKNNKPMPDFKLKGNQ